MAGSSTELLDVYDENMSHVGVASRVAAHQHGLWHRTFQCWILSRLSGDWCVLFQKRHATKETHPNLFDVSAAGHLLTGESVSAGIRELREEIGVVAAFDELVPVCEVRQSFEWAGFIDHEYCHVFALVRDSSLNDYVIQSDEVAGLVWVRLCDVLCLFAGDIDAVVANGFVVDSMGSRTLFSGTIERDAFVPRPAEQYRQVFDRLRDIALHAQLGS